MEHAFGIALAIYVVGFGTMYCLMFAWAGGEHHSRPGDGKWIVLNLAIWPFWVGVFFWYGIVRRKPVTK